MVINPLVKRDLEKVRRAVRLFPNSASEKPVLFVMVGLPGSGKSYFVDRLIRKIPATVLQSDFIRKTLLKKPTYTQREHTRVFRAIHTAARELLDSNNNVLIDATNLNRKYRRPLYQMAAETRARIIIIYLDTPREIARERIMDRRAQGECISDADWEVYQMLEEDFEPPVEPDYTVTPVTDLPELITKIAGDIAIK
ncbi:MAG: ATP-binding protein [Dehalogenimonas sp.]|uniref:ATP-binding protein n=1 Tax=Candidatus Dehalogenimonas loeffleri TaxID=3127115 RepID=A0ABZ2JA76_9CHLR|nr:ATP-binding protein [Dehalogenimonas sp.]